MIKQKLVNKIKKIFIYLYNRDWVGIRWEIKN